MAGKVNFAPQINPMPFLCRLSRFAGVLSFEKDDAHVFRLLMHHLGLSKDTFDSNIYILGQTVSCAQSNNIQQKM